MSEAVKRIQKTQKVQTKPTKSTAGVTVSKQTPEPKNSKYLFGKVSKTAVLVIGIIMFACVATYFTISVLSHRSEIKASEDETSFLQGLAVGLNDSDETGSVIDLSYLGGLAYGINFSVDEAGYISWSALDEEMRGINSDYVCWIKIDGTNIDYPVVRGRDNDYYLNRTFLGEENKAGTIFMDYRNTGDTIPHIIIYGHNLTNQGGMFTDLRKFLDDGFLAENNIITLVVNGHEVEFEVFAARKTDVEDPAYYLDFSHSRFFPRFANRIDAPLRATQILTLSTCTSGGSDNERLIIQASRVLY